jgi:hypothetical protein
MVENLMRDGVYFRQGRMFVGWMKGPVSGKKHLEPSFNETVCCGETYIVHEENRLSMLNCKNL